MCNLDSPGRAGQDLLRREFAIARDEIGNRPSLPGIHPNTAAPVVPVVEGERRLSMMRWGLPSPKTKISASGRDSGVTNVRNTDSGHWKRWLGPANRCLLPFTAFSAFNKAAGGDIWFALGEERPLACFAGVEVEAWTSIRKVKDCETTDDRSAFLTTDLNTEVRAIHPKAMPVILTTREEREAWLSAPWSKAGALSARCRTTPS